MRLTRDEIVEAKQAVAHITHGCIDLRNLEEAAIANAAMAKAVRVLLDKADELAETHDHEYTATLLLVDLVVFVIGQGIEWPEG